MMNNYLLGTLILPEIKFVEWSIQPGARLSAGSLLFTYESAAASEGKSKVFKYKCDMNGITVGKLGDIKPGDVLRAGSHLFSYENCNHSIHTNDMCAICGIDLRKIEGFNKKASNFEKSSKTGSFKMLHAETSVIVDQKEALEIARKDLVNLVVKKKLVLLVDLDHTLIHTTNELVSNELKEVFHYKLGCNTWYHTKFRPGYKAFLEEMHDLYQMHLITFGERRYAHTIALFMDPDKKYFNDRILSRNEIFNPISKTDNIKDLFPRGDLMVAIIDDREDVWNYARNLICVQPYVFFKNTGDINDPHAQKKESNGDGSAPAATPTTTTEPEKEGDAAAATTTAKEGEEVEKKEPVAPATTKSAEEKPDDYDPDDYLVYLKQILRKIHDEYYKIYETRTLSKGFPSINSRPNEAIDERDLPDLKRVVPLIKMRVLEGVVITFSGVIPTGYDLRKQRCYMMAVSLGAKVNEDIVLADEDDDDDEQDDETPVSAAVDAKKYEYVYDDESNSSGGDPKYTRSDDDNSASSLGEQSSGAAGGKKRKKKRYTTHLVAAKFGTSKVHEALKSKRTVHVVTPEWLINCNYRWTRCDESQFKLNKDYDYKNCLFHNEYNLHQKCAAAVSSSRANNNNNNNSNNSVQLPPVAPTTAAAPRIVECCPKFVAGKPANAHIKHSLSSSSVTESATKKHKRNEEAEANEEDEEEEEAASGLETMPALDEELFDKMDKEVMDELDGDDDEDEEEEEPDAEEEQEEDFEDESQASSQEGDDEAKKEKKKVHFNLSSSSSSSSSSTLNSDADLDDDSIDDEMVLALERDLAKHK